MYAPPGAREVTNLFMWADDVSSSSCWVQPQSGLCLSVSLSACLPVCLSACLHASLSVCLSACLHVCLSACLPVYLSVCLSACLPVYLSACLHVCVSACLPVYIPLYLSVCLPVYMSLCLSTRQRDGVDLGINATHGNWSCKSCVIWWQSFHFTDHLMLGSYGTSV